MEKILNNKRTEEDRKQIIKLSKDSNLFEKLVQSFAPEIYGYEKIKLAILHQLVGGVRKENVSGTSTRGDIHILLVGDPSSCKTKLLQIAVKLAPKSVFVSGRQSNVQGLTVTIQKDNTKAIEEWTYTPGVLAKNEFCAMDHLNEMTRKDRTGLYEVLVNQTVTVCMFNVYKRLNCQVSVLASAVPQFGRFDIYELIAKQIDIEPRLISRFDLIFIMMDLPDPEKDKKMADFILSQDKLSKIPVSTDLLKKYIVYAKSITPIFTPEAKSIIKDYYVKMRNIEGGISIVPIYPRHIESLIRIAESSSKLRLCDKVLEEDAKMAIELLDYCLRGLGLDSETGKIDADRIYSDADANTRHKIHTIKKVIDAYNIKIIPIPDIISKASLRDMEETEVYETLDKLKYAGDIFEPKRGFISKL